MIEIIDEEDDIWERHLFDFLYAELDDGENCYILADGEFYQIEKSYKKRVDDFYDRAKIETIAGVSQWDGCIEGEYNKNQTAANILVMDEVFVHPEGNNKFEVCDLLTDDRHIIHVKIFDIASQPLGHLFNQGMLSAQCMADESIRKKIQAKIAGLTTKEIFYMPVPFEASNYIVTFLILCKDKKSVDGYGRPKIPFLARAVFKESCTTIKNLGYNVVLSSLVKV